MISFDPRKKAIIWIIFSFILFLFFLEAADFSFERFKKGSFSDNILAIVVVTTLCGVGGFIGLAILDKILSLFKSGNKLLHKDLKGAQMKRYENGKISIPHKQMVELKNSGKLNLGMFNDISVKIADNPDLAPKAKSSGLAMHFWSWVAVGQFLYSIYWSFTGLWWVFIPSLFLMGAIHKANKKGTSQNLLFEAERDKEFYEKIRKLDGWNYEVDESVAKKYMKK